MISKQLRQTGKWLSVCRRKIAGSIGTRIDLLDRSRRRCRKRQETYMLARRCVQGLLLLCLSTAIVGCSNPSGLDSVQVTPATQSLAVGQAAQFTAVGTFGNAKHPSTQDITSTVTWTSTAPAVATVNATGLVT